MRHLEQRPETDDTRTLFFQQIKIATTGLFVIRREDDKASMNERGLAHFKTTKTLVLPYHKKLRSHILFQHSDSNLHLHQNETKHQSFLQRTQTTAELGKQSGIAFSSEVIFTVVTSTIFVGKPLSLLWLLWTQAVSHPHHQDLASVMLQPLSAVNPRLPSTSGALPIFCTNSVLSSV